MCRGTHLSYAVEGNASRTFPLSRKVFHEALCDLALRPDASLVCPFEYNRVACGVRA